MLGSFITGWFQAGTMFNTRDTARAAQMAVEIALMNDDEKAAFKAKLAKRQAFRDNRNTIVLIVVVAWGCLHFIH